MDISKEDLEETRHQSEEVLEDTSEKDGEKFESSNLKTRVILAR